MQYYVYILSNATNVALYTGVTSHLLRRAYEHRNELDPKSHTAKYHIHKLVYFEETNDVRAAIEREKQIKGWNRARKKQTGREQEPRLGGSVRPSSLISAAENGLPRQFANRLAMTG